MLNVYASFIYDDDAGSVIKPDGSLTVARFRAFPEFPGQKLCDDFLQACKKLSPPGRPLAWKTATQPKPAIILEVRDFDNTKTVLTYNGVDIFEWLMNRSTKEADMKEQLGSVSDV